MIILHWQNWMKLENCLTRVNSVGLMNKSTGQVTNILGAAVKDIFDWYCRKDKRLIVEDIGFNNQTSGIQKIRNRGNHHMTLFAYQRIASSIENQA